MNLSTQCKCSKIERCHEPKMFPLPMSTVIQDIRRNFSITYPSRLIFWRHLLASCDSNQMLKREKIQFRDHKSDDQHNERDRAQIDTFSRDSAEQHLSGK